MTTDDKTKALESLSRLTYEINRHESKYVSWSGVEVERDGLLSSLFCVRDVSCFASGVDAIWEMMLLEPWVRSRSKWWTWHEATGQFVEVVRPKDRRHKTP